MILQDYVVPVFRFSIRDDSYWPEEFCGTAFFINSKGAFITAAHVIKYAKKLEEEKGGIIGLVMRPPNNPEARAVGHIMEFSFADPPYDIAVGWVKHLSMSCFLLLDSKIIRIWDDVRTMGYPEDTVTKEIDGRLRPDSQGHKGYVLRKLPKGHILKDPHPACFEVSFPIPKGMSGAPLVCPDEKINEKTYFPLIGVCVGNHQSHLVDFEMEEITENGKVYKEKRERVIEYGLVHDLWPLRDWKPECLNGITLFEASTEENID
jgi:hypothetical protein